MHRLTPPLLAAAFALAPVASGSERPLTTGCLLADAEVAAIMGVPVPTHSDADNPSFGIYECRHAVGSDEWAINVRIETLPYFLAEKELGNPFGTGSVQGEWDAGKKWMKKRYKIIQIDGLGNDAYYYPSPAKTARSSVNVLMDGLHLEVDSLVADQDQLEAIARAVVEKMPALPSE